MSELPTPQAEEPREARENEQRISKETAAAEARALVLRRGFGTLCTASARMDGWPFGSVVPVGLDEHLRPLLLLATIAEHTRNIKNDPRVSVFLHDLPKGDEDVQTHARLTVMGNASLVPADERAHVQTRYMARCPDASGYFGTHDFQFFRVEPVKMRWIGGFGEIFWLEPALVMVDPAQDPLRETAPGAIEHMNEDHRDALQTLALATYGRCEGLPQMTALDQFGFDAVDDSGHTMRFAFETPTSPESLRVDVVKLVHAARAKLADRQTAVAAQ